MAREYPLIPTSGLTGITFRMVEALNKLLSGRGNNAGTFDLAASPATTTTVTNNRIESNMTITLTPLNATAATCDYRVTTVSNGSFVVTHLAVLATASFDYSFRG